eukprot:TRINITY_DN1293_c4_g2_i1.p1 TRINITY_DN1293_c4_g2~~TRINITY_DN1293_c4_g2_i1.p1  ORF type:complete len:2214 (+),score=877.46 TRINITY_DN1293_c4_g2_i1:177-6818(+)
MSEEDREQEIVDLEACDSGDAAALADKVATFVRCTYGRWRPERLDLFTDLVVAEGCVVDGDSLLIEALCNYNLDWPAGQGQLLHLIYLCEQFLHDLLVRGASVTVVFFGASRALWARDPSKLLARECLIRHLSAASTNPSRPTVLHFSSWWAPEWHRHLEITAPVCLFVNDAEQVRDALGVSPESAEGDFDAAKAQAEALDRRDAEILLRALVIDSVVRRMHVVYTSRLVRKDNIIHGFCVRSMSARFRPVGCVVEKMRHTVAALFEQGSPAPSRLVAREAEAYPRPEAGCSGPALVELEGAPLRLRIGVTACGAALRKATEGFRAPGGADLATSVARAWVLHLVLLRDLPLHQRAQDLTEFSQQSEEDRSPYFQLCDKFTTMCLDEAARLVSQCSTATKQLQDVAGEFCDLWDFRMLHKVVGLLLHTNGEAKLAPARQKVYDGAWAAAVKASGRPAEPSNPVLAAAGAGEPPPMARDTFTPYGMDHPIPLEPPNELIPLADELVGAVCKPVIESETKPEAMDRILQQVDTQQGWLERSERWKTRDTEECMQLDDLFEQMKKFAAGKFDLSGMTRIQKERAERKWARINQKFLQTITWGAQSMEGFLNLSESRMIVQKERKGGKSKGGAAAAADEDPMSEDSASPKKGKGKGAGKPDKKVETEADRIRKRQLKEKKEQDKRKLEQAWKNFFARLEVKEGVGADRLQRSAAEIEAFVRDIVPKYDVDDSDVATRALLERVKLLERVWVLESASSQQLGRAPRWEYAVSLFRAAHQMIGKHFAHGEAQKAKIKEFQEEQEGLKQREEAAKDKKGKEKKEKKDKKGGHKDPASAQAEEAPVYRPLLTTDELGVVRHVLVMLGLKDNCRQVDKKICKFEGVDYEKDGKHKLPSVRADAKQAKIIGKDVMLEGHPATTARFQMTMMGHLMDRPRGGKDPRVPFRPDEWQTKLLDFVDRGDSVLCTAPTSAGKTFISYYCMKKILLQSNEDVVVYVAPTRALVNQVSCDVYSRFGGKTYSVGGWSMFGVLGGRDMVQPQPPLSGPFYSQVLITVPSVFEAVMLSPRYQQWAQRIKCVIFDEVHSVDVGGEGHIWERLLMVTRCQFVALSATIGNAEDFRGWLERTRRLVSLQEGHTRRVMPVYHNQRWNDLQKFVYVPRTAEERNWKTGAAPIPRARPAVEFGKRNLVELHPFSCVKQRMLEERGQFPQDLPLVPRESVELYDAMRSAYETLDDRLLGTYSDEDDKHKFRVERGEAGDTFNGRSGCFKGLKGPLTQAGKVWTATFDGGASVKLRHGEEDGTVDAELNAGGKKQNVQVTQEVDDEVMASVGDPDDGKPSLDPDVFFKHDLIITQARAREYEKNLKDELMRWVVKGKPKSMGGKGHDAVRAMVAHTLNRLQRSSNASVDAEHVALEQGDALDTAEFVQKNLLDLLMSLAAQEKLPAIVFNFDQSACEELAKAVVEELEASEAVYRESPEFKKKEAEVKAKQKQFSKQMKTLAGQDKAKKSKGGGDDDGGGDAEGKDSRRKKGGGGREEIDRSNFDDMEFTDFSLQEELADFTFIRRERGEAVSQEEYDKFLKDGRMLEDFDSNSLVLRCLHRGIGMHHNGLPAKYRSLVEKLFRMKHLKVVIATDTLALGIHSPCRTVVLAGDDVRLSTMQFRQMAGRAGRRGLDWVGHVVFHGVPSAKVERLMTGALPTLQGHHPLDPTLVLRLSLLHNHPLPDKGRDRVEVDQKVVREMAQSVTEPLFHHGRKLCGADGFSELVRLQYRYTVEYLVREGFIDLNGKGQHFAGLVTRPLYTEMEVHMSPSNLVLAGVLRRGLFQDREACGSFMRKHPQRFTSELLQALAWFFTRNRLGWKEEVHRSHMEDPEIKDEECPHIVHLKPVDQIFKGRFAALLSSHNKDAMRIYSKFIRAAAHAVRERQGRQTKLPVSQVDFSGADLADDPLGAELAAEAVPYEARSPFVALAGLDDDFHCVSDLICSLRDHLHVEEDSLPILDFVDLGRRKGDKDRYIQMNAAAYDFKQTGHQVDEETSETDRRTFLDQYNGLSQSESWYLLHKFFTTMENLTTAMERAAPAWKDKDTAFKCCVPDCPEGSAFKPEKAGLYKCHTCEVDGKDSWQCPTCYSNVEDCVVIDDEGRAVRHREHVYYRHVHDKFVQCLAAIMGDCEILIGELTKKTKHKRRQKRLEETAAKPKRPMLTKPTGRGRGKRRPIFRRRR